MVVRVPHRLEPGCRPSRCCRWPAERPDGKLDPGQRLAGLHEQHGGDAALRALVPEIVERNVPLIGADSRGRRQRDRAETAPEPSRVSLNIAVFELPSVIDSNPNVVPLLLFQ